QILVLKQKAVRYSALLFLAVAALVIYFLPDIESGWLLSSKSYSTLATVVFGAFARLGVYITSTLIAASVLAWIRHEAVSIKPPRARTLYVYLLHGFFVQFFRETEMFNVTGIGGLLGIALLSALIVVMLSSKWNIALWQPVIEGSAKNIRQWF